jgi:hypothetical protein
MVFREFIKHTFQFLVEAVLHIISFIFCWSMNVQNNDMTPGPLSIMYDILSLTNSTLLTSDMILLCTVCTSFCTGIQTGTYSSNTMNIAYVYVRLYFVTCQCYVICAVVIEISASIDFSVCYS